MRIDSNDSEDYCSVLVTIKGETTKNLLVIFSNGQALWLPKSTIKGAYIMQGNTSQPLQIQKEFLLKNKINSTDSMQDNKTERE